MKRYRVTVRLEEMYDDIVAENEEDAFVQASDLAIRDGSWSTDIEEIGEVEDED